jgi:hypothetical protein
LHRERRCGIPAAKEEGDEAFLPQKTNTPPGMAVLLKQNCHDLK